MLVCVNQDSMTHGLISASRRYCVNLLGAEHMDAAHSFASTKTGDEKFDGANTVIEERDGVLLLKNALANIVCELSDTLDVGSHTVFIGIVKSVDISEDSEPLLYGKQTYGLFTGS